MIIDRIAHWRRYDGGTAWEAAMGFLETLNPAREEPERVPILGDDVFARIMSYPTRTPAEAVLEAHDVYIDIQASLVGSEAIAWFPRADLAVETPYDAEKDAVFFQKNVVPPAMVCNLPGQFTLLFPEDAHMPQLVTGDAPETVKKVVIKLRADLWGRKA